MTVVPRLTGQAELLESRFVGFQAVHLQSKSEHKTTQDMIVCICFFWQELWVG